MLTGDAAFAGDTVSDTIAGILEREPDCSVAGHDAERVRRLPTLPREGPEAAAPGDIGEARLARREAQMKTLFLRHNRDAHDQNKNLDGCHWGRSRRRIPGGRHPDQPQRLDGIGGIARSLHDSSASRHGLRRRSAISRIRD
jgi:hypothetical protein